MPPVAQHGIKPIHTSRVTTDVFTSPVTASKGLYPGSISRFRAPQSAAASPPQSLSYPVINPSFSAPSSYLLRTKHKQRHSRQCYAAVPEPKTQELDSTDNTTTTTSNGSGNSVKIETAKELAAREFTWFDSLRELLGYTGNDPGHWNFSPEWWGSQGGSFGRTDGQVVFSKISKFNGLVEVTAHPASFNGFSSDISNAFGDETRQEWRVLRFNQLTRQSVSRVAIISDGGVDGSSSRLDMQQRRWLETGQSIIAYPECVAAEYLKTITSVFGALLGLQGLFQSSGKSTSNGATTPPPPSLRRPLKVLCIGLGGGTLPHFIAHHFPQAHVDAVEIDPIVVEAAIEAMGLPVSTLPNLHIYTEDGFEFLKTRSSNSISNTSNNSNDYLATTRSDVADRSPNNINNITNSAHITNNDMRDANKTFDDKNTTSASFLYDVVCIDAFDGDDNVPPELCSPEFVNLLGTVLNKNHGTVVMNFHDTIDVTSIGNIFYRHLVLENSTDNTHDNNNSGTDDGNLSTNSTMISSRSDSTGPGCCFSVSTQKQRNLTLACARGLDLPLNEEEAKERLRYAGVYVGHEAGYRFPAGVRAERGFVRLF